MKIQKISQKKETHILAHDGKEQFRGTEAECFDKIHDMYPGSWASAMTYEGYEITPISEFENHPETTRNDVDKFFDRNRGELVDQYIKNLNEKIAILTEDKKTAVTAWRDRDIEYFKRIGIIT